MLKDLIKGILESNKRSVARGISLVENEVPEASKLLKSLYKNTGAVNVMVVAFVLPSVDILIWSLDNQTSVNGT